jgi:hypothetical protein
MDFLTPALFLLLGTCVAVLLFGKWKFLYELSALLAIVCGSFLGFISYASVRTTEFWAIPHWTTFAIIASTLGAVSISMLLSNSDKFNRLPIRMILAVSMFGIFFFFMIS